jgi:mRNA interferase YafQ
MYEIFRTTSFKKDYKKLSNKEKDLLKSVITILAEGKKLDTPNYIYNFGGISPNINHKNPIPNTKSYPATKSPILST